MPLARVSIFYSRQHADASKVKMVFQIFSSVFGKFPKMELEFKIKVTAGLQNVNSM